MNCLKCFSSAKTTQVAVSHEKAESSRLVANVLKNMAQKDLDRGQMWRCTWIEAWSLADKILLEALHFLQTCMSRYVKTFANGKFTFPPTVVLNFNIPCTPHLGMYMSTYSPASFCMVVQGGFGFSEKMRSNNVKTQSTSVKGINHKQRVKFCQNINVYLLPLLPP